jgi:hypothetical protein
MLNIDFKFLELFKLTKTEEDIFKSIFLGEFTNNESLIKKLRISRRSFYLYRNSLAEKGLIVKTQENWQVTPKEVLLTLVNKQLDTLKFSSQNLEKVDWLQKPSKGDFSKSYYLSKGYLDFVNKAITISLNLSSKYYYGIGNSEKFESVIGENVDLFWQQKRVQKNIKLRFFVSDQEYLNYLNVTNLEKNRETKLFDMQLSGYLNVFENKIIFWDYNKLEVHEILEEIFCKNLFKVFDSLWAKI